MTQCSPNWIVGFCASGDGNFQELLPRELRALARINVQQIVSTSASTFTASSTDLTIDIARVNAVFHWARQSDQSMFACGYRPVSQSSQSQWQAIVAVSKSHGNL